MTHNMSEIFYRVTVIVLKNTQMILVIVTKYFRVSIRVSVLKNTHMILVIVTKYFRVRVLKNTQMILVM